MIGLSDAVLAVLGGARPLVIALGGAAVFLCLIPVGVTLTDHLRRKERLWAA